MKNGLIVAIMLITCLCAYADPIDNATAKCTASWYLAKKGKVLEQSATVYKAPRRRGVKQVESSYYYVFNAGNDQGYVIVSGDDRTSEILGYVDKGSFDADSIPENMKAWLQGYVDEIKYMDENNVQVDNTVLKARRKVETTRHSVAELLSCRWNQGHPYNLTCPRYYKSDGTLAYSATGCVATALAQVMYYYKYPARTKALIPAKTATYTLSDGTKKTVSQPAIARNTLIDWDNMQDTYSCSDSHEHTKADTAVADLMKLAGRSVGMGYGSSSGASTSNSASAFITYFGYDDSSCWADRNDYTIEGWFNLIYNEIATGHPVAMAGHSSGGGHAFVLDGFDGDQLFHVNWGWGGSSNGWFLIGILNPGDKSGMGASTSSDGYCMSQGALIGVKPADHHKDTPNPTHCYIRGVKVSGTDISATFINWSGSVNSFNFGIVRISDTGTCTLVGSSQTKTSMGTNVVLTKTFSVNSALSVLAPGTYKLSPASKLTNGSVWVPKFKTDKEYIQAEVDSQRNVTLTYIQPRVDLSIEDIQYPGCCIVNKEQEVKVTFRNNGDEYYEDLRLYTAQPDSDFVDSESHSNVGILPGETSEASFYFTPTVTGTHRLQLRNGSEVVVDTTMQVVTEGQATLANLSVTSFTFLNSVSGTIYGNRLSGKITIKNNGKKKYEGRINLKLWKQAQNSNTAYSQTTTSVVVSIDPGDSEISLFEFNNLDYGPYYRIQVNYTTQSGTLTSGGLWDHKWTCTAGVINWKSASATLSVGAAKSSVLTSINYCASLYDGVTVSRVKPNANPNTIYNFENCTTIPTGLDGCNLVVDGHADTIRLVNDYAYYCPSSFTADTASYTHIFPTDCDGNSWQTFTLPFEPDSIYIGDRTYTLGDTLRNHFWIYEFSSVDDDGQVCFTPVTTLRANTPYIIAGDKYMAGESLVFTASGARFFKAGTNKMLVKSNSYQYYGTTYSQILKNAYVLNTAGTAFDYVTTSTTLQPGHTYFLTALDDDTRVSSIPLPTIPTNSNLPDGIRSLTPALSKGEGAIYNMAGQRVNQMQKGMYIVNGRKVLIK